MLMHQISSQSVDAFYMTHTSRQLLKDGLGVDKGTVNSAFDDRIITNIPLSMLWYVYWKQTESYHDANVDVGPTLA